MACNTELSDHFSPIRNCNLETANKDAIQGRTFMDKQPKTKLSPLTEETRPARVLVLSYPVFILSLSLALVVGILAGSFLSQHMAPAPAQNVVHQSQPQTQAQPQARQEQPQISRETQQHIAELEKKVLQDGKNRDDWVHLGHLYFDTNQPENAIAAYEHALALDRKDSNVLTDLGVMYRATAQYTKALACFEEAQAITPGHLVSLYNKGVVLYFDLHRHEEGIACWQELVRQDPDAKTPNGKPVTDLIRDAQQNSK
ncbi:MAG: tetratricopeptide repeat protein [Candidatus Desulfovibrio faecigallinarum]|nr:tetratricopeptide repeat protein [Candidatus Desulfovibrio faecigallinarum]